MPGPCGPGPWVEATREAPVALRWRGYCAVGQLATRGGTGLRTGAGLGHRGHVHEAAVYGSDAEFLDFVLPFLRGGVEAGEPTVVAVGRDKTDLLKTVLGSAADGVSFLDGGEQYARPASAIRTYCELLKKLTTGGAGQIRLLGALPREVMSTTWAWWARYEAAANQIYDDFPVWTLCSYDSRVAGGEVLDDVRRTHPYLATAGGRHLPNPGFESPADFLRRPSGPIDPLEALPPLIDLINPSLSVARYAAKEAGLSSSCDDTVVQEFVFAVDEAVTNAICHGYPPIQLRLWSSARRLVGVVSDIGSGPSDPLTGLVPTNNTQGTGLGLWVAHQTCSHITLSNDDNGFTIRFIAGEPARPPVLHHRP